MGEPAVSSKQPDSTQGLCRVFPVAGWAAIRTHRDDNAGAAVEVDLRVGQEITCAKLVNLDTMLISPGIVREVTHDRLGCRTQFVTEVRDARKFFLNWGADVIKADVLSLMADGTVSIRITRESGESAVVSARSHVPLATRLGDAPAAVTRRRRLTLVGSR